MKKLRVFNNVTERDTAEEKSSYRIMSYTENIGSFILNKGGLFSALYFENIDEKPILIAVQKYGSAYSAVLEKSIDGEQWNSWCTTSTVSNSVEITPGQRLYVRSAEDVGYFNDSDSYYNYFLSTGKCKVGGNIMSLGYKNFLGQTTITKPYAFARVFHATNSINNNLIDARNLVLPATTLSSYCYEDMFQSCTSLITSPKILPATTLATQCYYEMFYGCTSLVTAPELPATTLANSCYSRMFYECTNLAAAPELPATTLSDYCYNNMFNGCKNINRIKIDATNWNTIYANGWLSRVSSTGTFLKPKENTQITISNTGIPSGWDIKMSIESSGYENLSYPETIYANQSYILVKYDLVDDNTGTVYNECTYINVGTNDTDSSRTIDIHIGKYNHSHYECDAEIDIQVIQTAQEFDYSGIPMYFENMSDSDVTIGVVKNSSSAPTATLETSTDNEAWESWGNTDTTALTRTVPVGGKLYIRRTSNNGLFNNTYSSYNKFTSTGNVNVGGNIMSLGYNDFEDKVSISQSYAYGFVFISMNNLIDASNLILPATTLAQYCYYEMFHGCANLKHTPELPATALASSCYNSMFYGCTNLTDVPELPATTLANNCYSSMFNGCTNLTDVPELPATTLADYCYSNMFQGCTSLTAAPELPATTLVSNCYQSMFQNCSKLNYIKAMFTTAPGTSYTKNWVSGVSSTGTFIKNKDASWNEIGVSAIPSGWNAAPLIVPTQATITYPQPVYANQFETELTIVLSDGTKSMTLNEIVSLDENTTGLDKQYDFNFEYNGFEYTATVTQISELNENMEPFYFENKESGPINVQFKYVGNDQHSMNYLYSYDKKNWFETGIINRSHTQLNLKIKSGVKLYIKNKNIVGKLYYATGGQAYDSFKFGCDGLCNIGGNVASLLSNKFDIELPVIEQYAFRDAFRGSNMIYSAKKLILPFETIESNCYSSMFYNCTNLKYAMKTLPATTLTSGCYLDMFYGCTSLTTAPELPATTLQDSCYYEMFYNCKNLTTAPELSATTLANNCYYNMFKGCTSLTTAPALSATTLANNCYYQMFYDCTSLTTAPALPATTLTSSCYFYMFGGCTSLITAPELPATTLADSSCFGMFYNCTSLTTAPELPATTLETQCYREMFKGCTNLNYIKALFTTEPSSSYTSNWVSGVASTGTFVKNFNATWDIKGVNGVPEGWSVLYDNFTPNDVSDVEYAQPVYANQTNVKVSYTLVDTESGIEKESKSVVNIDKNTTGSQRTLSKSITDGGYTFTVDIIQSTEIGVAYEPMYFENISDDEITIGVKKSSSYYTYTATLETSTDNETWTNWGSTDTTALTRTVPVGGKLYIKATSDVGYFNNSSSYYNYFTSTGDVNVCGNIMSLGYDNFSDITTIKASNGDYSNIFRGMVTLKSASNLTLPATTLNWHCYSNMFYGCTSLTTAPELPATTLVLSCYNGMFNGCNSLNYIKALFTTEPSTSYTSNWVSGVASTGTFVKNLDATWDVSGTNGIPIGWSISYNNFTPTKAENITYSQPVYANQDTVKVSYRLVDEDSGKFIDTYTNVMIGENTTGSTRVVEKSIMSSGFTFNVSIEQSGEVFDYPLYFENVSNSDITISIRKTNSYAHSVTLSTTYNCFDSLSWTNWGNTSTSALTRTVPVGGKLYIKATSDVGYFNNSSSYYNYFTSTGDVNVCGNIMSLSYNNFENKTSITTAYTYCYTFNNMTTLVDSSKLALPATTLSDYCYYNMFNGCTSLTTVPELTATTLAQSCYSSMFNGCTSLTTAPELPATTLAPYCYYNMFKGCTSLTTAPALSATTLVDRCYASMFYNCTNLNYIEVEATGWNTTYASNWVSGVASTGTFVKPNNTTIATGTSGIPSGWTVQNV